MWIPIGRGRHRRRVSSVTAVLAAVPAGLLLGGIALPASGTPGPTLTTNFTTAGCGQTYTLGSGISPLAVEARGEAGGSSDASGGKGDEVSAILTGIGDTQEFDACVGYGGGSPNGGGASGIALGADFTTPVVIAGGGGGASGEQAGGNAGYPNGADGVSGYDINPWQYGDGGGGAQGSSPGTGGGYSDGCPTGTPGGTGGAGGALTTTGPGVGGDGVTGGYNCGPYVSGGGGGGYAGGGAGGASAANGGGGGGSDFCATDSNLPGSLSISGCTVNPLAGTSTSAGPEVGQAAVLVGPPVAPDLATSSLSPLVVHQNTTLTIATGSADFPTPVLTESGALPNGITFTNNGDGTASLSGTPQPGSGGTYPISVTADNGYGTPATKDYTLVVDEAPNITSAASSVMDVAQTGSVTITTAHAYPADPAISETGALPAGVTFVDNHDGTATLAGTPKPGSEGTYDLTIAADNGVTYDSHYTDPQQVTLRVLPPGAVLFTSAGCQSWQTPDGVGQLSIDAVGAAGDRYATNSPPAGRGDGVASLVSGFTGPTTLDVCVDSGGGAAGSYPGGGGGGASGVSVGSDFGQPLLVAGGGGGAGYDINGGGRDGGGDAGYPSGSGGGAGDAQGGGGTDHAPGAGGSLTGAGNDGHPGAATTAAGPGSGGSGGFENIDDLGGGGGGAGWYGGGGGAVDVNYSAFSQSLFGGGGGGSDYCTNGSIGSLSVGNCQITAHAGTKHATGQLPGDAQVMIVPAAAPTITSDSSATFTVGSFGSFTVASPDTTYPTVGLEETGKLPSGVTFVDNGDGTATLSGTPHTGTGGVYPLSIAGSNGISPDASQSFTLTVDEAPGITSADTATFTVGGPGAFTVHTSGVPTPSLSLSGTLPDGVKFADGKDGTATLSGTPHSGTAGTYPVSITASNGVTPDALQSFTLTVAKIAQVVHFTTGVPTAAKVGGFSTPAATGGGSGQPVLFAIGPKTTNSACSLLGPTVSFDHAGVCEIDATQAGNADYATATPATQTFSIDRADQQVTFVSPPPSDAVVYGSYTPALSGGGSGNPVVLSVDAAHTTHSACSVANGVVHFDAAGTCAVAADQAGNADYNPAPTATQSFLVNPITQTVAFTSAAPTGATVGDSYRPSVTGSRSGYPVTLSVGWGTTNDACSLSNGVFRFDHTGICIVDAVQNGDAIFSRGEASQTVPVGVDPTTTAVTIDPSSITATVTPVEPTATTLTGTVTFAVDGVTVGAAPVSAGVASLQHVVPTGATGHVSAVYGGSPDFASSAGSTARSDPTITAALSSATRRTRFGWWRSPVTVSFTCTPGSAALTTPCPAPVTVRHDGAAQRVTGSVTDADGGAATRTVTVNLDRERPVVHVRGVRRGHTYHRLRRLHLRVRDALSGVWRSHLRVRHHLRGHVEVIIYTATARDRAGNVRTVRGRYYVRR